MITADQILVKQINRSLVLDTIYKKEEISRADIAKKTGLNRSTVSALADELLAEGLIIETGTGVSQGGRRPVILRINKEYCSIIGVDLGVNYILAVLTNFLGEIVWEKRILLPKMRQSSSPLSYPDVQYTERMLSLIQETVAHAPDTVKGIIGIGVGVPGIVDYASGLVLVAPNLSWKNLNLKQLLEEKVHIPVYIDNEANAGAIGEKWFGLGKQEANLIYISAGTGVGTGLIINHELYRGSHGLAGEAGHMTIDLEGVSCSCENTGCWEEYASEKALIRYYQENRGQAAESNAFSAGENQLTVFDIVAAAEANDMAAIQALEKVGRRLGVGLACLVNIFNPSLMILGNVIGEAGEWLMDEIYSEVSKRSLVAKHSMVKILPSKLNMHACALGAVALVISRVYATPVRQ